MLNLGSVNFDNSTPVNTLLKIVDGNNTINVIGKSGLSEPDSGILLPSTIYSAAGTSLPAASAALKGATAIVSDATTPTYGAAYVSGGAVYARVLCTGSGWITA